jgi:hypothetical protein
MANGSLQARVLRSGAVALFAAATLGLMGRQGPAARQVGAYRDKPLDVFLPIGDGGAVEQVLLNVAAASGVRFGLERVVDDPLPDGVRWLRRSPTRVRLTGQTLGEALNWLTAQAPPLRSATAGSEMRFKWVEAGDMVLVSQLVGQASFLDAKIGSFEVREANLPEAIAALHHHIDVNYPIRPIDVAAQPGMRERPASALATFTTRFTLSLRSVNARDVLTASVRAAGDASWIVRYATPRGEYAGVQIAVASPGGVTHITRARG